MPTAETNRRNFLALSGAAIAASIVPFTAAAAPVAAVAKAPLPTWIVGTPGEWDHEIIRAATREAAIRFRAEECDADEDDEPTEGGFCECCACTDAAGYEATRVPQWDGRPVKSIGSGDWLQVAFAANCERCSHETDHDTGYNVAGKAVCEDCMTLEDWDIVDPELAAEKRADLVETSHVER